MSNFKLEAEGIRVSKLVAAIEEDPSFWGDITIRQEFPGTAHRETETIFLRGPRAFTFEQVFDDTGSYDYPVLNLLAEEVKEIMVRVQEAISLTELGRMMVVNLPAMSMIDAHTDTGRYADYFDRWHLVLKNNDLCTMKVGGEVVQFAEGDLWKFDHRKEHEFVNAGDTDRWHLIFDGRTV